MYVGHCLAVCSSYTVDRVPGVGEVGGRVGEGRGGEGRGGEGRGGEGKQKGFRGGIAPIHPTPTHTFRSLAQTQLNL